MSITGTLILIFTVFLPIFVQSPSAVSSKKGLANTLHSGIHPKDAIAVGASWQYFWWNQAPTVNGVESVPMIDTPNAMDIPVLGNSLWLMGFNEPDVGGVTFITPELAAQLWHTIEVSHADRLLLSPAVVISEDWLDRFRDEYYLQFGNYPVLAGLAVHCYRPTAADCEAWVGRFISKARAWGIPQVWVTEFAFSDPAEMETFVRWMEAEPMIARPSATLNAQSSRPSRKDSG